MKFSILALSIALQAQSALASNGKACFNVDGMTCISCTVTTKVAVKQLNGINKVDVYYDEKKAVVIFDSTKTNSYEIKKKIDSTGYKATLVKCEKEG